MSLEETQLLLDSHIWEGLAAELRLKGHNVVHINHTEHRSADDEIVLALAASEGRALLTYNHQDFVPLARQWYETGREHSGIILSVQLPRGELLRQVGNLLAVLPAAEMKNSVRWLQEFR
jgi:predicted nuclease of predicted toxin-antitoxin system